MIGVRAKIAEVCTGMLRIIEPSFTIRSSSGRGTFFLTAVTFLAIHGTHIR